jgi:hypothetical protein
MLLHSLLALLRVMSQANASEKCSATNCTVNLTTSYTCAGFNSWSELNEAVNSINCAKPANFINFKPAEPIILTSELNMSLLTQANELNMHGIGGINLFPWPSFIMSLNAIDLNIYFSTIKFYVNYKPPSGYTCGPDLIPDDSVESVSLISRFLQSISLNYGNTYGSSSDQICPFLFKNAQLNEITLNYQVDSFLFVSLLRFQSNVLINSTTLGSSINSLVVNSGYNYKLDTGFLFCIRSCSRNSSASNFTEQ